MSIFCEWVQSHFSNKSTGCITFVWSTSRHRFYSRCVKWCTVSCFNIINSSRCVMDWVHYVIHTCFFISFKRRSNCLHKTHGRSSSCPVYIPFVNGGWPCASAGFFHGDCFQCSLPRFRSTSCRNCGAYPLLNISACFATRKATTEVTNFIFYKLNRLIFDVF